MTLIPLESVSPSRADIVGATHSAGDPAPPSRLVEIAAQALADSVVEARGAPSNWRAAPIRQGLASTVIDAIMTPRVTAATVDATVRRYEQRFGIGGCSDLVASFAELGGGTPEKGGGTSLGGSSHGDGHAEAEGGLGGGTDAWREQIATNHRTHSSLDAPYKAGVILQAARLLVEHDVDDVGALWARAEDESLRAAWCALPGQSSGASWRHLLLVSGYTEVLVCPLTRRFARRVLPRALAGGPDLATIIAQAADLLVTTAFDIEHQMWRAAVTAPVRAPAVTGQAATPGPGGSNGAREHTTAPAPQRSICRAEAEVSVANRAVG